MNTIDQKLYELFPTEDTVMTDEFTWNQMTFKREPELHDVFRVAKEKWMYYFELNDDTLEFWNELWIQKDSMNIPYIPTLKLLKQSDETKQDIINLFS
jgi:hypothetical protein